MARATASHDLNNLLGKILGAAELALDRATDPAVRAELELIADLAEEAGSLVAALAGEPPPAQNILSLFG